ncbi:hypothetical protein ACJEM7_25235, partial [Escherichia coli]
MKSFQQKCEESADYCRTATDRQLPNIYRDETDRAERYGDDNETGLLASAFAAAARSEMIRRG